MKPLFVLAAALALSAAAHAVGCEEREDLEKAIAAAGPKMEPKTK
jgi:hypothetical protein